RELQLLLPPGRGNEVSALESEERRAPPGELLHRARAPREPPEHARVATARLERAAHLAREDEEEVRPREPRAHGEGRRARRERREREGRRRPRPHGRAQLPHGAIAARGSAGPSVSQTSALSGGSFARRRSRAGSGVVGILRMLASARRSGALEGRGPWCQRRE